MLWFCIGRSCSYILTGQPKHACVQAMRDIVAKCLVKDPSKRPTAAQLLDHKFFKVRLMFVPLNSLGFARQA